MGTQIEIPQTCFGAVVVNEGPDFQVEVRELPVPDIGADEVLIRLNATGLCQSDVHFMMHDLPRPKMSHFATQCAGHEGAGVVVKVGANVTTVQVGQRACCKSVKDVCHTCEHCKAGRDNYCSNSIYYGLMVDGSFKQYIVARERYMTMIPDGVTDYVAAPLMCSGATMYSSIKTANLQPGQWCAFPGGGGGVDIQGVQLAAAMGLRPIVIDTGSEREELSRRYGAEHFVDFKKSTDPVAEVVKLSNGGVHAVFVTAYQAYSQSLHYLGTRVGGKVMCVGFPPASDPGVTFPPASLMMRNQSFVGTLIGSLGDIDKVLEFAERGKLKLEPTVVPLSGFNDAIQKLKNGQVAGRIVVDFNLP